MLPRLPLPTSIGVPRIELGPNAPKAFILPLYYTPAQALAGRQSMHLVATCPVVKILIFYYWGATPRF